VWTASSAISGHSQNPSEIRATSSVSLFGMCSYSDGASYPEFLRDPSHRERLRAFAFEQFSGNADDLPPAL